MEGKHGVNVKHKRKHIPAHYAVDFVTALPRHECVERLQRAVVLRNHGPGGQLAPMQQRTILHAGGVFEIERSFPGGLHPIRLRGQLEDDVSSPGTWVQGAITHDSYNQVLVEGLIIFMLFFLMTALLFLRLKARSLGVSLPLLLLTLALFSVRWRALRAATDDLTRWLRRRLYVTADQINRAS
jgi:hypothetical protein